MLNFSEPHELHTFIIRGIEERYEIRTSDCFRNDTQIISEQQRAQGGKNANEELMAQLVNIKDVEVKRYVPDTIWEGKP